MFNNIFKKETQSKKTEKKSDASTTTNTQANGNSFTTSISHNKTESYTTTSHAKTTQVIQNQLLSYKNEPDRVQCSSRNTFVDQITYRGAPPRSAFTSTPLTIKSSFPSRTTVDAKPFTQPIPTTKPPAQNHLVNTNAVFNSTTASELRTKLQIKVEKSAKFYDNQNLSVPVYKTRSKRRGKLLLINNIKFLNGREFRRGAELDESNACELFKQIGFEVKKCTNLNKEALMKKVTAFRSDSSLSKVDIAAVIIMSHGTGKERSDSTEIVCIDGQLLPTTWIINEFDSSKCPQLNKKPKIFIFQCCRGSQCDIQHDGLPIMAPRLLSDMLIAYATVPGFVAHRDPVHGTWYIQAICKVFMEHAHNTDVEGLLKIVDDKLASLVTDYGSKQTSSYENRGFKTCFLHPKLWE